MLFISYSTYSVSHDEHTFYLDNPTNENIEIILDSKIYKLKAKTYEILKLKTGEHIAELSDGRKVYFKIFENSKGGIINPTGAPYILNDFIPYESSRICVEWDVAPKSIKIYIDGVTLNQLVSRDNQYTVLENDFIIDKNYIGWDYDIFENVDEEIMKNRLSPEIDIHVFSKIYSRYEFIDKEDLEYYEANRKNYKIKAHLPKTETDYDIPNSQDSAFQKYINQIIELDKAYKDAKDEKTQKKILEEFEKLRKILWSEYNFGEGSFEKGSLKKLKLHSLDKGVIIIKVEE